MLVNSNFFQMLGVQPLLGRAFNNDGHGDTIISYGLWQRQFGGDPNRISQDMNLMDVGSGDRTLIGVLAPKFDFPQHTEAWLRYDLERGRGGNHYLRALNFTGKEEQAMYRNNDKPKLNYGTVNKIRAPAAALL